MVRNENPFRLSAVSNACPAASSSVGPFFLHLIPCSRRPRSKLLFLPFAVAKVCHQLYHTFRALLLASFFFGGGPSDMDLLMMQNPPGLPTFFPAWAVCRLTGARLLVDWHNFGYTILGLALGLGHPLVGASRLWERFWATRADLHLCVTQAMRGWLSRSWGVHAEVLYDRPPEKFRRLGREERHAFLERICRRLPENEGDAKEEDGE